MVNQSFKEKLLSQAFTLDLSSLIHHLNDSIRRFSSDRLSLCVDAILDDYMVLLGYYSNHHEAIREVLSHLKYSLDKTDISEDGKSIIMDKTYIVLNEIYNQLISLDIYIAGDHDLVTAYALSFLISGWIDNSTPVFESIDRIDVEPETILGCGSYNYIMANTTLHPVKRV